MGVMDTSVPFLTDENGKPKRYPLNAYYRTPGMERLAKKIRFNGDAASVFAQFSIMTAAPRDIEPLTDQPARQQPRRHGPDSWNWPEEGRRHCPALRTQGYKTPGKAHGPNDHEGSEPLNLGFDINVGGASFGAPGSYYAEKKYGKHDAGTTPSRISTSTMTRIRSFPRP